MRHRRVKNSESVIAGAATPRPAQAVPTAEILLDLGLRPDALSYVEGLLFVDRYEFAAKFLRMVLLSLPPSMHAKAIQRACLGDDGRTIDQDAAEVKCSRSALFREEQRVRKALAGILERRAQR